MGFTQAKASTLPTPIEAGCWCFLMSTLSIEKSSNPMSYEHWRKPGHMKLDSRPGLTKFHVHKLALIALHGVKNLR